MASYLKDLFRAAVETDYPLAPLADLDMYLNPTRSYFKGQPILKGLISAMKSSPRLSWEDIAEAPVSVGTLLATRLNTWVTPNGVPKLQLPHWGMDIVFQVAWENLLDGLSSLQQRTEHQDITHIPN
ncbi:hypothetical protein BGX31_002568 [Mortierella sp. GBA43]|nr:hypothetical protein BGX31_002568 [Mortierella sp. GBA43]